MFQLYSSRKHYRVPGASEVSGPGLGLGSVTGDGRDPGLRPASRSPPLTFQTSLQAPIRGSPPEPCPPPPLFSGQRSPEKPTLARRPEISRGTARRTAELNRQPAPRRARPRGGPERGPASGRARTPARPRPAPLPETGNAARGSRLPAGARRGRRPRVLAPVPSSPPVDTNHSCLPP
jgi:hypothetical protein